MASSWYVEKRGRQLGPFTGPQLKELAASGRLEPHDMVRRSDRTDAVPAAKIKGLSSRRPCPQGRRDASPPPLPTSPQRAPAQAMPAEPPTAHFTSPKPEVRTEARATMDHGDRIERLQVSDTWKRRFRAIEQDPTKFQLNVAAFIFGPFYYAFKGLWKKGLVLTLLGAIVSLIIELVARGFGWDLPFGILSVPAGAICGMMANRDVYRKEILGETFWPQLGLIESPGKIVGLATIVFVITSALSVSLSPGPNLPEMGFPEAIPLAETDGPAFGPKEESGLPPTVTSHPATTLPATAAPSPIPSVPSAATAEAPQALIELVKSSAARGLKAYRIDHALAMGSTSVIPYVFLDDSGTITEVALRCELSNHNMPLLHCAVPGDKFWDLTSNPEALQREVNLGFKFGSPPSDFDAHPGSTFVTWVYVDNVESWDDGVPTLTSTDRASYNILISVIDRKYWVQLAERNMLQRVKINGRWKTENLDMLPGLVKREPRVYDLVPVSY